MEVVIVNDSKAETQQIYQHVHQYFKNITVLSSQEITPRFYKDFDIYFLDIEIQPSGQYIAEKINVVHPQAILFFMTQHQSYAFETQISNSFYFIRKSHFPEDLTMAIENLDAIHSRFLSVQIHQHKKLIDMKDIQYIDVYNGKVTIHTQEKDISYWGAFRDIVIKLPTSRFMRIHQSYILNKDYIQGMYRNQMIINGQYLPISKKYIKEVREFFKRMSAL